MQSSKQYLGKIIPLIKDGYSKNWSSDKLAVFIDRSIRLIDISQIAHFESDGNYTNIFLISGEKILSCKTLKRYEERIKSYHFLRIHKSFLINPSQVVSFDTSTNTIKLLSGKLIPVARAKKQELMNYLKSLMA